VLGAVRAYDIACIELHGTFAQPNYPAAAYGLAPWPQDLVSSAALASTSIQ
jgi:hypothetical protein